MDKADQPRENRTSLESLPHADAIKEQIRELESLNLQTVDDDRIYKSVLQLLAVYGGRQIGINPVNRFYRVRKNLTDRLRNNFGLEWYPPLFTQLRLIWYPQPEACKTRGRVNQAGESVFYCADSIDTAVLEMKPKLGEYLTILECVFVDGSVQSNIFEAGIHEGPGSFNPNYGASPPDQDHEYQRFLKE